MRMADTAQQPTAERCARRFFSPSGRDKPAARRHMFSGRSSSARLHRRIVIWEAGGRGGTLDMRLRQRGARKHEEARTCARELIQGMSAAFRVYC